MKRIHLFEFMDLKWYPNIFRKIQTKILQIIMIRTNAFDYAIPYITKAIEISNTNIIVDLCSGASGPWLRLIDKIPDKNIKVILTDKFPNIQMFKAIKQKTNGKIEFIEYSVDALDLPEDLKGVKTIFTGFHHFKPNEVYKIIESIKEQNQSICIFDYVPNKFLTIILFPLTFIISFIQFYVLSFFVRPLSFLQIVFTNIIPIIPLVSAWDGFVSGLRKYGATELKNILKKIDTSGYNLEIGEDFSLSKATPMVYLIGSVMKNDKA